ncbi:MAG TPA: response regulator transcription factor [Acetobacteraceae bacterium]|nr:response regulator transcription factor [Acetobacteraceae bacterium]
MEKDFAEIGALIADRQMFFRRGMFALLQESRPGWTLVEAGTFEQVWTHLQDSEPDLLLVDLELPDLEGVDGIRRLRALCPAQRIVVMADSDTRETILECLAAGAQGYVLKSSNPAQFLRALETVLSGGVFAPASLTGAPARAPVAVERVPAVAPRAVENIEPLLATLTDRQRDVFRLLAEGCATKTIARRLNLAVGTVKVHLAAIYRLLGAHSRMEAMAKACGGFAVPGMLGTSVSPVPERIH